MDTRTFCMRRLAASWLCLLLAFCVAPAATWAKELTLSASLNRTEVAVGESAQLDLVIEGTLKSEEPPEIDVDGLNIQYYGPQTQVSTINSDTQITLTHTYLVTPERAGTFTIPAITLEVGGKKLTTTPLKLVATAGGGTGNSAARSGGDSGEEIAFAEWVVPKTSAYLGEAVPAELRLYVSGKVEMSLQRLPVVRGDGFTVAPLPQRPRITHVTRNGQEYDVAIFKTALTPAKAGKLRLEPTRIETVARIQRQHSRRPRGFPDVFDDPFFDNAFGMVSRMVTITADALEMEVKPLPDAGKPPGFSGAIGQFTFETKASPSTVKTGDPVTLTATVSGIGSFARMGPPVIREAETPGWRAYPPSTKFEPNDDSGDSGKKTFEFAMIPDRPQSALPEVEFSYFDPAKDRYVTLKGAPLAIQVIGAAAPSPSPASDGNGVASAPVPPGQNGKPSGAAERPTDILFIRTDGGAWGRTFGPLWRVPEFWYGQLVPMAALLLGVGWRWGKARRGDLRSREKARQRQEKAATLRILQEPNPAPERFHTAAVRALHLAAACSGAANPESLDAEALCRLWALDGALAGEVRRVFAAHEELQYAGAGGAADPVSPERRQAVLNLLQAIEKMRA